MLIAAQLKTAVFPNSLFLLVIRDSQTSVSFADLVLSIRETLVLPTVLPSLPLVSNCNMQLSVIVASKNHLLLYPVYGSLDDVLHVFMTIAFPFSVMPVVPICVYAIRFILSDKKVLRYMIVPVIHHCDLLPLRCVILRFYFASTTSKMIFLRLCQSFLAFLFEIPSSHFCRGNRHIFLSYVLSLV